MPQYYYLVASLPSISPESDPVSTVDSVLEECRRWLTIEDFAQLERSLHIASEAALSAEQAKGLNATVLAWIQFETGLRNALARERARARGVEAEKWVRRDKSGADHTDLAFVQELAHAAAYASNPMEAEIILLRGRWKFLDERELGHFFDLDRVLVYMLKLDLLRRKNAMKPAVGLEAYGLQYQTVSQTFPLELGEYQDFD